MKRAFCVFTTFILAFCVLFISCNLDLNENEADEPVDVLESFQEDTKTVLNKLGEVAAVYYPETSRFYNGQEIREGFRDKNGDPVPVSFNSWLLAYRTIFRDYTGLFELVPINAMLHNSHGYNLKKLSPDLRYLECCVYRFLEDGEYNKAGDICFVEFRLVCDEIRAGQYYAKSLSFNPSLTCEISSLGINLFTGEHISYDLRTGEIGGPEFINEYNDDGHLAKVTYYYENGAIAREVFYDGTAQAKMVRRIYYEESGFKSSSVEVNSEGYMAKRTFYYESGEKEEYCYDGTKNNVVLLLSIWDENGHKTRDIENNSSGYRTKIINYYDSGEKKSETTYDGTENCLKVFSQTWNENGTKTDETEYNAGGYAIRSTSYYGPEKKRSEIIFDGTENNQYVSETYWYENGKKSLEQQYSASGYLTMITNYSESGDKESEFVHDGTAENLTVSVSHWYDDGTSSFAQYNASGYCEVVTSYYATGEIWIVEVFDGSANGTIVSSTVLYKSGYKKYEATYDANGNIVTQTDWADYEEPYAID